MTILRPITNKSPSTASTVESTNLPFGFTLQPFANCRDVSRGDDDAFFHYQTKQIQQRSHVDGKASDSIDWNFSSKSKLPTKANLAAKCTHCGSPLNPTSRFVTPWSVLCNFCGNTYRVDYETQSGIMLRQHSGSDNDSDNESEREMQYKLRYDGRDANNLKECKLKNVEYSLPLFGISTGNSNNRGNSSSAGRRKKRGQQRQQQQQRKFHEIYSLPASMCPPLLTILIDGTSIDTNYYRAICSSLNRLLELQFDHNEKENNDHNKKGNNTSDDSGSGSVKKSTCSGSSNNFKGCKIGIFIMTKNGGLSVFDLKSTGGNHVKHLWVNPSPLKRNKKFVPTTNNNENSTTSAATKRGNGSGSTRDDNFFDDDYLAMAMGRNWNNQTIIPLSDVLDVDDIYVPLDSDFHRSCVEGALRGLADSTILNQACQRDNNNHSTKKNTSVGGGAYFGSTIQYILEFLDEVAYHPGMYQAPRDFVNDNDSDRSYGYNYNNRHKNGENNPVDKFLYAGGKIMCFLAGPPNEIGIGPSGGRIGTGGFGGSCAELGKRFSSNKDANASNDTTTITNTISDEEFNDDIEAGNTNSKSAGNMKSSKRKTKNGKKKGPKGNESAGQGRIPETAFSNVDDYYQNLGIQCAHQALSVEVFGLVDESQRGREGAYLGFPYLRLLSDRSGGSGPLLISLSSSHNEQGHYESNQGFDDSILVKEVTARSTLTRHTSFGGILRIRLSPTLSINDSGIEDTDIFNGSNRGKVSHRLFEYYSNHGMYGSFSPSSSDPEVFFSGACDITNTLAFQVEISSRSQSIDEYAYVEGASMSDVRLIPAVQICFAYTSVVMNNGNWTTVRRIRVSTHKIATDSNVEAVTSSLNAEALAVILFHRFYAVSLIHDVNLINSYARTWLLNTLLDCYRSAEREYEMLTNYGSEVFNHSSLFHPADRLLKVEGGQLGKREILLAQGHEKLQVVPLLIFCLLQCDALRPTQGTFRPSIDARIAAAANMGNMSPSVLSRCIAPRLELWASGCENTTEQIHSSMGMSLDDIRFSVIDTTGLQDEGASCSARKKALKVPFLGQESPSKPRPMLLLDSPREIAIYDCSVFTGIEKEIETRVNIQGEEIPDALRKVVQEAAESYRVKPFGGSSMMNSHARTLITMSCFEEESNHHLLDALVEDSILSGQTCSEWMTQIAEVLHGELTGTE